MAVSSSSGALLVGALIAVPSSLWPSSSGLPCGALLVGALLVVGFTVVPSSSVPSSWGVALLIGASLRCPPRCGPPHRGSLAVPSSLVPSSSGCSRWCLPRRCPPHGGVRCGALLVGASLRCPPRWCPPRRGVHGGAFLVGALLIEGFVAVPSSSDALLIGASRQCPPRDPSSPHMIPSGHVTTHDPFGACHNTWLLASLTLTLARA